MDKTPPGRPLVIGGYVRTKDAQDFTIPYNTIIQALQKITDSRHWDFLVVLDPPPRRDFMQYKMVDWNDRIDLYKLKDTEMTGELERTGTLLQHVREELERALQNTSAVDYEFTRDDAVPEARLRTMLTAWLSTIAHQETPASVARPAARSSCQALEQSHVLHFHI